MKIINLLPKPHQEELKYRATFRSLLLFSGLCIISYVLVFAGQFGVRIYLDHVQRDVQQQTNEVKDFANKQENTDLKNRIRLINNQISDYTNTAGASPKWSNVLLAFTKVVPDGVAIQSLTVDYRKRLISIRGFARTREAVITVYNNILADTEHFQGIDYPLENVTKPTDVSFSFTFTVKEGVLK